VKLGKRSHRFYLNIVQKIWRMTFPFSMGGLNRLGITSNISVIPDPESPTIFAKLGSLCHADSLQDTVLIFQCDTISKWPKYHHLIIVTDNARKRSIPIVIRKWFLNREITVFADTIYAFLQSLCNYAFRQDSMQSLAERYGISPKQLPQSFGIRYEDWERQFKIPDLGTDDVTGSFMLHVYSGNLDISKKTLFDD